MKNIILKTALIFSLILTYGLSYGQTACPKAGTADCPLIKNCPKKGTADCPLVKKDDATAQADLANCPLKGTADCPLVKNCPKKGTADCPYTAAASTTTKAAEKEEASIPACCRKKH